jgi:hypothetical protein
MAVRAIGGVFVWALESLMLALCGLSTILVTQTFGGTTLLAGDIWVFLVILISCVVNVAMQTLVAMVNKQSVIVQDVGYLHKSVAQAHCCVVSLLLVLYIIIMQQSLVNLNWANAFYTAAPGLVWLTGSITLAFITVLWITSMAGSWTATAVGDYNSLFCTLPTTSMICILYPIVHEIGNNGLMVCTDAVVSTVAILYVNLAIASSFTLTILDHVEFDPANILPRFMRTVGDRIPYFRIYSLLHGISVSTALLVYAMVARNVNWVVVIVIFSLNVFITVTTSISASRFLVPLEKVVEYFHHDKTKPVYPGSVELVTEIVGRTDNSGASDKNESSNSSDNLTSRRMAMLRLDGVGCRKLRGTSK